MKIYIDVTMLINVSFLTGIQRVVREVVIRLLKKGGQEIVLLYYNDFYRAFKQVDSSAFLLYYDKGEGEKKDLITDKVVDWKELQPGDIFFDIDGVWNLPLRRSVVLPRLKKNGVLLAVFIHDIIPITHPQFCHEVTTFNFMNYIGAYLQYADLLITSVQSTLNAIAELLKQLKLPPIPGVVSWLGADFQYKKDKMETVEPEAIKAAEAGKYVLMVGTIEPRKNHALILEAFDSGLFDRNINLVFAGRIGWKMQEFQQKIEKHPKLGQQFFVLNGLNDASIDYLYKNAYCVAFPTFNEGFGLPVIEAFQRGTPVLASDIPVLREVGGEFCEYFDPESKRDFSDRLLYWLEQPEIYQAVRKKIQTYVPVNWDTVADRIWRALLGLLPEFPYEIPSEIKQMVYLSARAEDLLESLPFVEHFMPFIQELVLCCPDSMKVEMEGRYHGRFRIQYLTDSELLAGTELPEDHTRRNFYLRCLAIQQDRLDDVFIMADDDYRPLGMISQDVFLKDGIYQEYYCYHLEDWLGDQGYPTSFDRGMRRTLEFLQEQGYTTWMYESHMPQVIDRRVFRELLKKHSGIEQQGLSEWSVYFNYLNTMYPNKTKNQPYVTLAWPGSHLDWEVQVFSTKYLFENYYRELYKKGGVFENFSPIYYAGIEQENVNKSICFRKLLEEQMMGRAMFQAYCANYELIYREWPMFQISITDTSCEIFLPEYVGICEDTVTRIPFSVEKNSKDETLQMGKIGYRILDVQGNPLSDGTTLELNPCIEYFSLPVTGIPGGIKGILEIQIQYSDLEARKYTRLSVMRKGVTI